MLFVRFYLKLHWAALENIIFDKKHIKLEKKLDFMAGCFSLDQNLNFSVSYNKIGSCGIQATACSRQEFDIARCGEQ